MRCALRERTCMDMCVATPISAMKSAASMAKAIFDLI